MESPEKCPRWADDSYRDASPAGVVSCLFLGRSPKALPNWQGFLLARV